MYRAKVQKMLPQISLEELRFVSEMIENAVRYASTVTNMDAQMEILPFRYEGEELKEVITKMDAARRRAHDAFIGRLNIVNRICKQNGLEVFYDGPEDRMAMGDCAFIIQREYDSIKSLLSGGSENSLP
mgnify:CR=1 FL=1